MTASSGRDASPEPMPSTTAPALSAALAGHLLVLLAAVSDSVTLTAAVVAAIACSLIALAALTELAPPPEVRVRRIVTALTVGHGVAAATMLAGVVPGVPRSIPLTGIATAAAVGVASQALGRASLVNRQPRPLTLAPRIAAIVLVIQVLLWQWETSATSLSMPLRTATLLSITALGVALLGSLSVIALRVRTRWAIAGLLAWTVGWMTSTADLGALLLWSLGGPFPTGPHQIPQLDAALVRILATIGGLMIGAALVTAIRDARFRHSAYALLAGHAVFGVIAAVAEHRIALAADLPSIAALRRNRDMADVIAAVALAGVLWLYWRRVASSALPPATTQGTVADD